MNPLDMNRSEPREGVKQEAYRDTQSGVIMLRYDEFDLTPGLEPGHVEFVKGRGLVFTPAGEVIRKTGFVSTIADEDGSVTTGIEGGFNDLENRASPESVKAAKKDKARAQILDEGITSFAKSS